MHQVIRGTVDTAEFEIYYNNNLINADGDVLIKIEDADNLGVTLESGAAINDPALGKYTYDLRPTVTQYNRVLKATWTYEIDGIETYGETFHNVYTPYASISDIINYYDFGTRPTDLNYRSNEQIANAESIARMVIDNYTNQSFGKQQGYQEEFGVGGDAIQLMQRMNRVDKLYENGVLVIDYTVDPVYNVFGFNVELTQSKKVLRISDDGSNIYYDPLVSPTILYYGRFRDGSRYKVEGEIGWEYVPVDIQTCAKMLAGDYLSRDAEWRQKYLRRVNLAEIQFELAKGAFNGTGNVIVDDMLDTYRNYGITVI